MGGLWIAGIIVCAGIAVFIGMLITGSVLVVTGIVKYKKTAEHSQQARKTN